MSQANLHQAGGDGGYWDAINDVRELRVDAQHPPTSSQDGGMDFERCAALHNAIVRHAWTASGYAVAELPSETWWDCFTAMSQDEEDFDMDRIVDALDPSVLAFLQRVIYFWEFPNDPKGNNFFSHLPSLEAVGAMFSSYEDIAETLPHWGDVLTLYSKHWSLGSDFFDGIIYNQRTHTCVYSQMDPNQVLDAVENGDCVPWQPLETVLSVYIEMIERRKAVALNRSVLHHDKTFVFNKGADGSYSRELIGPSDPRRFDPITGVARLDRTENPWVVVSYASQDVTETVAAWENLVEGIETRMPSPPSGNPEYGPYSEDILKRAGIPEGGFLWRVLSVARIPRCTYLGPGLRYQTNEEILNQPFKSAREDDLLESNPRHVSREHLILPLLLLRGDGDTNTDRWGMQLPSTDNKPTQVACGLYLDFYDLKHDVCPFENGCRLVFPYQMHIKTSDGTLGESNLDFCQIGPRNPFLPAHSTPIATVLDFFNSQVHSGKWAIGADGVEGEIKQFRNDGGDFTSDLRPLGPTIGVPGIGAMW